MIEIDKLKLVLEMEIENDKDKKKVFNLLLKTLENLIKKFKKIEEYDKRKNYRYLYYAIQKITWNKFSSKHIDIISKALDLMEGKNSSYLLHELDKLLYFNDDNLFSKKESFHLKRPNLYEVHKNLRCLKCGNIGAVEFYGKWNGCTHEMGYALGFGGTIPYECLACDNKGLTIAMETYLPTFEYIDKNES